jgi:hypothetical protein
MRGRAEENAWPDARERPEERPRCPAYTRRVGYPFG